ncbi:MAG: hypothetical protein WC807_14505 [Hyphomicrobium sp.]|jgi:hypothetical protein
MATNAPRTAEIIRAEREAISAQIEKHRVRQKALSDELREVEGPIPDRAGRPAKEASYTIKPA